MPGSKPKSAAPSAELLDRIAAVEPLRNRLRYGTALGRVAPAAQAPLFALLARESKGALWILCAGTREVEELADELATWCPDLLALPEFDVSAAPGALPDPDLAADRSAALERLASPDPALRPTVVLLAAHALDAPIPDPAALERESIRLTRGTSLDRAALIAQLESAGFEPVPRVAHRGQFAVRGGILDIHAFNRPLPVRIELFGDEIESLRAFDPDGQLSVEKLETCSLLLAPDPSGTAPLRTLLRPGDRLAATVAAAPAADPAAFALLEEAAPGDEPDDFSSAFLDHGLGTFAAGDLVVDDVRRRRLFDQIAAWRDDGWTLYLFCNNEGEAERLREWLAPAGLDAFPRPIFGALREGFTLPAARVAALSDAELFGRYRAATGRRLARQAKLQAARAPIDFTELAEGDLVVHAEHGIARFLGIQPFKTDDHAPAADVLLLEFADGARMYVPLDQSHLVARYVGIGKRNPPLSTLGDAAWGRARAKAEKAVADYAATLLKLHAERESQQGFAAPPDTKWQAEFEAAFLYEPTPDQLRAIEETKRDMESPRPMDRLVCGDVGFGKTEVAIRAAFKAVMSGKQVAFLVPTTVLAQQHFQTLRERMSDYPVRVDLLSRFRSPAEQRASIQGLAEGSVDIAVGTHRLISSDVSFKNLGLVIVDEEQRFGVRHKERFKERFHLVDILTLSATPIPRTLYLSLMGARDLSTIETPPKNRIPVETTVCAFDEKMIRDAIRRELARDGQVYVLHNRIATIGKLAERIRFLCPGARVDVGHGQMHEDDLEEAMRRFVEGETDVFVSTTIIESGLDIPNANTIVIDRADRFGLADLYQLRGRVGRSTHKAYAYLMLPRDLMASSAARKRVGAIRQYSALGAGFKIAMRDLEIRGAGNILGTAQSGHIINIGFDLYCQLLRTAIARLKGEKPPRHATVPVRVDFAETTEGAFVPSPEVAPAFIPSSYIENAPLRIQAYRAVADATSREDLDRTRKAWRDRFGRLPDAAENFLALADIRVAASTRNIQRIEVKEGKLMVTRNGDYVLVGGKFPRLESPDPADRLREIARLVRTL